MNTSFIIKVKLYKVRVYKSGLCSPCYLSFEKTTTKPFINTAKTKIARFVFIRLTRKFMTGDEPGRSVCKIIYNRKKSYTSYQYLFVFKMFLTFEKCRIIEISTINTKGGKWLVKILKTFSCSAIFWRYSREFGIKKNGFESCRFKGRYLWRIGWNWTRNL